MHVNGKISAGVLIAAMLAIASPAAMAQQPRPADCAPGAACVKSIDSAQKKGHSPQKSARKDAPAAHRTEARAPHPGDSARRAPMLQQARNSRLPAPPQNQHYRVMDDRVVRVDDKTMKVVAVVGLVAEILR